MSELFTADKAREVLEDALRIKEENKILDYKKRIEKLIEDTPEITRLLENINLTAQDGLNQLEVNTGVLRTSYQTSVNIEMVKDSIEVLKYLGYKIEYKGEDNMYIKIIVSW